MKQKLIIDGRLPTLNEYSDTERKGWQPASNMKKKAQAKINIAIRQQLQGIEIKTPVKIHYTWYEQNRKRDLDNVCFAKKFIQDSLVETGLLKNDGWKHIEGFTDTFCIDKENPRIEVEIEEI